MTVAVDLQREFRKKLRENLISAPPSPASRRVPPSVPSVASKKKKKLVARPVYQEAEKWEDLDLCAQFEELVFEFLGDEQTVSRNELIVSFLDWSRETFWEDKGGRPANADEMREKAKRHAEAILKKKRNGSK